MIANYLERREILNSGAMGEAFCKVLKFNNGSTFLPHIYIFTNALLRSCFFFFFGCIGSLLLHAGFSSCGERGLPLVAVHRPLIVVASLVAEHGL